MLKISLFLLLATSAMPAIAERGDDRDPNSRRASQSEQSESRSQRAERPQRAERAERREARGQPQQVQVAGQVQAERTRSERIQRHQPLQQQQAQPGQSQAAPSERLQRYQQQLQPGQSQGARSQRLQRYQQQQVQAGGRNERLERYRQRQLESGQREAGQLAEGGAIAPRQSRIRTIPTTTPQVGQSGPIRADIRVDNRRYRDRDGRNRWTNHWRNDRRYDWRRHRHHNRSVFRIGYYYDPFGYSYRRLGIGSYLYSNYYQSNYWIDDPWQYRLPPVYGPYRWVRYHNDALLIDTYSGEVVDVIYGFFW